MATIGSSRISLRIGTRGSKLARWQAEWVAERLRELGHDVQTVPIATQGDADHASPIGDIGTGVFTKEIQRALLANEVDLAVHSLKDLPTEPVTGLVLAAVPPRASPADVLVLGAGMREPGASRKESPIRSLCEGARVGTGSVRRQAQLLHTRPDLSIVAVRGNVDTRLAKLDSGELDALVLAEAGLVRLGLANRITQVLPFEVMLPAVGQGALGIECRADDATTRAIVASLDDVATHAAVRAERALLADLRGGCLAPVAALARIDAGRLQLAAVVLDVEGKQRLMQTDAAAPADAVALGRRVADALLARGAAQLIAGARQ